MSLATPEAMPDTTVKAPPDVGAIAKANSRFNYDIEPPEEFVKLYEDLRPFILDKPLIADFRVNDQKAVESKRRFVSSGTYAVAMAFASVFLMALWQPLQLKGIELLALLSLVPGVLALAINFVMRREQQRANWLEPMFIRERLRQWHFQVFLDGAFVEKHVANLRELQDEKRVEAEKKIEAELLRLRADHMALAKHDPAGYLNEFLGLADEGKRPRSPSLFFQTTPYKATEIAELVHKFLSHLRIKHQWLYCTVKLDDKRIPSLREKAKWLNWVSQSGLVVAVGCSLMQFFFALTTATTNWNMSSWVIWTAFFAAFASVSAASARALRGGLTLPEEDNSYTEYSQAVAEIMDKVQKATLPDKQTLHEELEKEAVAELRRFLRMKSKATFLS
jgi:hypothetical protein